MKTWISPGKWGLPGGGLHRGEDRLIGALRELAEETGLNLRPDQLRPLPSGAYRHNGLQFTCHYFIVRLDKPAQLRLQMVEISAAEWVSYEALSPMNTNPDVFEAIRYSDSTLKH